MNKQLPHWPTVLDIIRAAMENDVTKARSYAALLASRVEEDGDSIIAERIRRAIANADSRNGRGGGATSLNSAQLVLSPVDPESRSSFIDETSVLEGDIPVLDANVWAEISRFVEFQTHEDAFLQAGFTAPRSILLYGPPGCGKNTTAMYIAQQLKLPLLTARLDAIVSSFLGTTAKNLRSVFEHASRRAGILFLDEFDALAKMRDDANEVGELKRIVNSLIQNMDAFPTLYVIAATNHEHLLDPAIWRRFDVAIHLSPPNTMQRAELLTHFLKPMEIGGEIINALAELTEGWNGAELRRVCVRTGQDMVLHPDHSPAQVMMREIWHAFALRHADEESQEDNIEKRLVAYIDSRMQGRLPARIVAQLVGISLSKATRLLRQSTYNGVEVIKR
jgi:ATPase family protein associated with various cellular activities (AAA)